MRVKYEVDKDKMVKFLDYVYATNKLLIDDYSVVIFGYIIDKNLVNHSFDILMDLCRGRVSVYRSTMHEIEDLLGYYLERPENIPLGKECVKWIKIGADFMLTNCKKDVTTKVLKGDGDHEEEHEMIRQYVIDNKEEFPEVYLDLML